MSITVFSSTRKALVTSIAMATVLGSFAVTSVAHASTTSTTSSSVQVTTTSALNNFTSTDWLNGIWRKSAGFSIANTSANRAAFVKGASVRLADGQIRKVTAIYVVGSNISVMLDGATLNGNTVGHPKTVAVVTAGTSTATAPAPTTATTAPSTSTTTATTSGTGQVIATSALNNFTSTDWLNGIWRKSAGFSIANTSANRAAFVKGASVRLADGQIRKVTAIYVVGSNISVMLDGATLNGNTVGHPKTVAVVTAGTSTATAPAPTTATTAPSTSTTTATTSGTGQVIATSALNNFTSTDWLNGIWRKSAGFSIANSSANKAAFVKGASVRLADGQVRKITALYPNGNNLSVMLDGATLNGNTVGHPRTVSVVGTATATTTAPTTTTTAPTATAPAPVVAAPAPAPTPVATAPAPTPAATTPSTSTGTKPTSIVGVNLAGAEFGTGALPGVYEKDYIYPPESYFKRYADMKMNLVRLPFRWERIQPKLGGELNAAELQRLMTTLDHARKHNVQVILDMHNYYRYYGKLIASPDVPISQFSNTWRMIAQRVVNHPAVYGYGLMNEPHSTNGKWPEAALAASKAIRAVDKNRWIFVAGDRWSNSYFWESANPNLINDPWMRDPKNNLVYEAHMYIDHDYSGTYTNRSAVYPAAIGVDRVKPFVEWLKKHKLRGFIGEHGVPDFSPSAITATDNLLTYLRQNCVPSTYWAAGPWWVEYHMSLDVKSGKHRPQLPIMQKHANAGHSCSSIGPTL
nr:GH5 family endoglucanase [uncultured bacterium]